LLNGLNGPFNSFGATPSAPAFSCIPAGSDHWFRCIATCSGVLTVDTCTSTRTFDTVLEVFSGTCGALNLLGCNDDSCGLGSRVSVPVTPLGLYYIRVGAFGTGPGGRFDLMLSCAPRSILNDDCTSPATVGDGINGPYSNVGSSTSAPAWPCGFGAKDVWFRYVATCTAPATFSTCSAIRDYDTVLEVFSGSCGSLTSLGCDNDTCDAGSSVTVPLTLGQVVLIRAGGVSGAQGYFELVVRRGTGTGHFRTVATGCGAMTISTVGAPNLGERFLVSLGDVRGTPFLRFGRHQLGLPVCPPAPCRIGPDDLASRAGSSATLTTPCDPALIGFVMRVQGVDLGAAGGCTFVPFTLTDTIEITFG
jgi:hypothetical protein